MNFSMAASLAALLVAAVAAGMTCILLLRKESNSLHRTLAGLLGATALANFANGVGLLDEAHALFWRKMAMLGELAQPAALLYVGLAFLKPSERAGNSPMLWPARITGGAGVVLMVLTMTGHVYQLHEWQDGQAAIGLGRLGGAYFLHIYCSSEWLWVWLNWSWCYRQVESLFVIN